MVKERMAQILCTKVIYKEPGRYIGWPTIAKTREGELLIVFSGDRDAHVCPWGKTEMVRSYNDGKSWSDPVVINNTPLDDRDAGIIQTKNGTLLVSWFTSTHFMDHEEQCRERYGNEVVDGWKERREAITDDVRRRWLGHWTRRSVDGGRTWENPIRTVGTAPHGPVELNDGRLLYIGNGTPNGQLATSCDDGSQAISVEESRDDGCSWEFMTAVPIPSEDSIEHYHEPHLVETDNGRLIVMFRCDQPGIYQDFLRQSESNDGGRTWSVAHLTPIFGYPPHLIRLKNGWLLVTYGQRYTPSGERACISKDGGKTWDMKNEIILSEAPNSDLGYPASVQLDDGSIFTIYYQVDQPGEKTCLIGTHWRLRS